MQKAEKNLVVLILAGGKGERFWPRSGAKEPKQLQKIYSNNTLLGESLARARLLTKQEGIFIGCEPALQSAILEHHPELTKENFILEPQGRNTAPMIALFSLVLSKKAKELVHIVMPADHYIQSSDAFCLAINEAVQAAQAGYLVTLGIRTTGANTQYGYIYSPYDAEPLSNTKAYPIAAFKEKPEQTAAQKYHQDPHYFWNSGIFIWRGDRIIEEFAAHAPEIINPIRQALEGGQAALKDSFAQLPKLPVDIAILEKSQKMAMVRAEFLWDDVGSWKALRRIHKSDQNKNLLFARQCGKDSKQAVLSARKSTGNTIAVDKGHVALLGVKDLLLVQEGSTLFLAHHDALDEMKDFLEQMKENPSLQNDRQ